MYCNLFDLTVYVGVFSFMAVVAEGLDVSVHTWLLYFDPILMKIDSHGYLLLSVFQVYCNEHYNSSALYVHV